MTIIKSRDIYLYGHSPTYMVFGKRIWFWDTYYREWRWFSEIQANGVSFEMFSKAKMETVSKLEMLVVTGTTGPKSERDLAS